MSKRRGGSSTVQRPKQARVSGKKVCDLGRSCPYQEEYQHLMEFSHDCEPTVLPAKSRNSSSSVFSGAGVMLGGESRWPADRIRREWATAIGSQPHARSDDVIQCELCKAKLTLDTLETHLLSHERKEDLLRNEQDTAYEQSILDDIQRLSALEEESRAQEMKRRAENELFQYQEALKISKLAAAKAARERAVESLLNEPGSEYNGTTVTIRFTLPSGKKILRLFRADNSVQDTFRFLQTIEELEGKTYDLRNAVNTLTIEGNSQCTFHELGIISNTSLLVVVRESEGETFAESRSESGPNDIKRQESVSLTPSVNSCGSSRGVSRTSNCASPAGNDIVTDSTGAFEADNAHLTKRARSNGSTATSAITLITPTSQRKKLISNANFKGHDDVIDLTLS